MNKEELAQIGGPAIETLERLIYIVGAARGGTSITNKIIGMHDSVLALGGPSHFLNHPWRYRNVLHDRLWRQLLWTPGYLRWDMVRDSLPEKRRQTYLKLINRATAEKNLHDLYCLYPLVRALDPEAKQKPDSYCAWLDKGNDFWGVDQLPRAFPKSQFVFVIRDPRGAAASLAKRSADMRVDTRFVVEPADIIKSAIYWRNLVRQQLRFARRYPDNTVFFCFEDMTTQPLQIVQSLYRELGLPPVPEKELKRRIENLNYGTSLDSGDKGKGISTAPNERWKSRLDRAAIDLISEICGSTARLFGYELPEPSSHRRLPGLVRSVPGMRGKAETLAKLVYLDAADGLAAGRRRRAPLRLVRAT